MKKYTHLYVPWHTHLYRAFVCLFVASEKPWHTHFYRALRSFCGDFRYNAKPKVAVVIPVYNVEPYLRCCLDSVCSQTFQNIEIICVNDGSTDGSLDILRDYAKKDRRIVIINQKNGGLSAARNAGLRALRTPFVMFVDSDDWISPDTIMRCFVEINRSGADVAIYDLIAFPEESTESLRTENMNKWLSTFLRKSGIYGFDSEFSKYNQVSCNKLYKTNIISRENLRFPIGVTNEDEVWYFFYFSFVKKIAYINEKFYNYRIRAGSIMDNLAPKNATNKIFDILVCIRFVYDFLNKRKFYLEHKEEFEKFAKLKINSVKWKMSQRDELRLLGASLVHETEEYIQGKFSKKETHVSWYVHLCRAFVSLFQKAEKPWHTHFYRAFRAFLGDSRYVPIPKKYKNTYVPWHTHLYRACFSLFNRTEKPWHVHLYRMVRSLCGDAHYNRSPKVSVIIPVYNVEPYLCRCLDSVCQQTLREIEIICVDDKSTDKSLEVLQKYAKNDRRIKIIPLKQNGGAAYARNAALEVMRGPYFVFIDPDDFYPSNDVLETLLNVIRVHNVQVSGGSLRSCDINGKQNKWTPPEVVFLTRKLLTFSEYQYDYYYQRFMFSTRVLRDNKISFPNYRRYQDPPFFVRYMACAEKFYAIEKETYAYCYEHKATFYSPENLTACINGI